MNEDPADLPLGEGVETEPGVVVERRCFLKTAAVALGAVTLPRFRPLRLGDTAEESLDLDEFIAEVVPVARALVGDTSRIGQDRYLLTVASYAVRLADVPVPEFRPSGQGPGAFIGSNGAPGPFTILHWKLEPGAEIRTHAHTYGNVVTLGLEGSAVVSNYEVVGEPDYDTTDGFVVRRTVTQRLTPGATNLVNLDRNSMHGFTTVDGARGLDITTRLHERRETPYLALGPAIEGEPDTFEGTWTD